MTDRKLEVKGESLILMGEKTLYWQEQKTLLAADVHLGKDTTFRKSGIAVPEAVSDQDLNRLSMALSRTGAERLILLGDFLHARLGCSQMLIEKVTTWRKTLESIEVILVMGNHDQASGGPPGSWNFKTVNDVFKDGPFSFTHHPGSAKNTYTICGHIHPAVRLIGKGKQSAKLPCFYFEQDLAIMPAFGSFTGTAVIEPRKNSKVYPVADNTIIELES